MDSLTKFLKSDVLFVDPNPKEAGDEDSYITEKRFKELYNDFCPSSMVKIDTDNTLDWNTKANPIFEQFGINKRVDCRRDPQYLYANAGFDMITTTLLFNVREMGTVRATSQDFGNFFKSDYMLNSFKVTDDCSDTVKGTTVLSRYAAYCKSIGKVVYRWDYNFISYECEKHKIKVSCYADEWRCIKKIESNK
jgi:hypothetical protein